MRRRPRSRRDHPLVVHLTTTDMSLDWLLAPQLQAFARAGYEVVGMSAPGPHVGHLAELGIPHIPVPAFTRSKNPVQDVLALAQLVRLLRQMRPEILHTHNPKPGVLGRIAGRLVGVPLIVNTQHGIYAQPTDRVVRRSLVYTVERLAASCSDVELVQNEEDVATLVEVLRVPRERVRLLGNGIDLERFDPERVGEETRRQLRTEWGIADGEIVCGVVGRLVAEKGVNEILEAARMLRLRGVPARIVIVGPTDEGKALSLDPAQIERARADGVVFVGERTDMPEIYASMDMLVTASWREGFPRAVMEASAMGRPVVATDIRGNRQAVAHDVTGVLVGVRDPAALSRAVERLVLDTDERIAFGAAARQLARTEFDQGRVIERTLEAYRPGGPPG